jgi:hypothetical protein
MRGMTMRERLLDIENIGRIGLMFINGDLLRDVLIDPYTCDEDDTNYNIPAFNALKAALSKIERMNPDVYMTGVLWQWYPGNRRMAAPAVVGRAHPVTGWKIPDPPTGWVISDCSDELLDAMQNRNITSIDHADGRRTCYFPVRTSTGDVAGALELTEGGVRGPYERNYTLSE